MKIIESHVHPVFSKLETSSEPLIIVRASSTVFALLRTCNLKL